MHRRRLLTAAEGYGKAPGVSRSGSPERAFLNEVGAFKPMVKPEWGTKRTCPKCGTRFYDLGKEDPITCIECGVAWEADPVLKSKQPLPFDAPKKDAEKDKDEDADLAEALNIDDEEPSPDDDVDLGGDDDIGVNTVDDDDEQ
jgi:uncharacterized protein (TIGR02300 family)